MTKIGYITGNLKKNQTGLGSYVFNLIEGVKNENEVSLIRHNTGDTINGCKSIIPHYYGPYWYLSWSKSLQLFKKQFQECDIIHNAVQYPISPSISSCHVITIHDLIPLLYPELVTPLFTLQSKIFYPKIFKDATRIISVSHNTKKDILNFIDIDPKKIDVIHHGVSDHFRICDEKSVREFKIHYNLQDPFILFVGALEPKKNIPSLIKAFNLCLKEKPSLKLVIAGKKSWKYESIFTLIKKLHLESKIRYLNFIPYKDLPYLYNSAKVFVFPSAYEGFGFPPLEAMKCGIPVIVSNRSSLPEIVGPKGLTVDPDNYEGLSELILKLLNDDEYHRKMANYSYGYASRFSWDNCISKTLKSYKMALDE